MLLKITLIIEYDGSNLHSLTVNSDVLALDGLDDEVAHHPPVVGVHSRAERVEDAGNAHFRISLHRPYSRIDH